MNDQSLQIAILVAGALFLAAFAISIIYSFSRKENRLKMGSFLLETSEKASEPGKPSVSRLQMLIWNFIVAFAFLYVIAETSDLAKLGENLASLFNPQVLILLGISNGTYFAGKVAKQGGKQPGAAQAPSAPDVVRAIPEETSRNPQAPAG